MQNRNVNLFSIVAVFLLAVFFGFQIQAVTVPIVQADLAPQIYVTNSSITSISGNEIKGEFTILNDEQYYLSDLNYEIKLFQGISYENLKLVDVVANSEPFFVAPGESITKSFTYIYPKNIVSDDYTLRTQIITSRGTELGWMDAATSLTGTAKFLDILGDYSQVIVNDASTAGAPIVVSTGTAANNNVSPSTSKPGGAVKPRGTGSVSSPLSPKEGGLTVGHLVATTSEGVVVSSTSDVIGHLRVQNSGEEITVIPQIRIFQRQVNMPVVKEYKDAPITFAKGETKDINLTMPKLDIPESYLAEVKFYQNSEQVSGIQYFRWVVEGLNGKIIYAKADADYYKAGGSINLKIQTTGPADASDPGMGKLEVSVSKNNTVIAKITKDVSLGNGLVLSDISIPVKEDIVAPVINIKLTKDGKILNQQTINLPVYSPQAKKIQKSQWIVGMYWIVGLLLCLIILISGIVVYRNKKKNRKINEK
jgi:hypothetical protein